MISINDIRNFATQSLLNRFLVYLGSTIVAAILATLALTLFNLPTTPAYTIFLMALIMVVFFYMIDPENEYTAEDVVAVFMTSVAGVALMAILGYASDISLIKQYAAPLVYMQEAARGAAAATGVASTDIIGLLLMNLLAWNGGLFSAMGAKYMITERRA